MSFLVATESNLMAKSLLAQGNPLSTAAEQLAVLNRGDLTPFPRKLAEVGLFPLTALGVDTLQINVGKLCNQTCKHCHVDAGPDRREVMSRETMEECLRVVREASIPTVDLTGGAPEMNPNFRWLVAQVRGLGARVIDRCNLTILLARGFDDLPDFLAANQVEVVASLPYHQAARADAQRGAGVFDASIRALRLLNERGYGREGSGLVLNLVYNPSGAFLPGGQASLEADFRRELLGRFGVEFNHLFAITNMPISRFLDHLLTVGLYEEYMERLVNAFNGEAARNVMCRTLLSVGWDGRLYDCDFNQMLEMDLSRGLPRRIQDFDLGAIERRRIAVGTHCYGCAAGSGSSCGGETTR